MDKYIPVLFIFCGAVLMVWNIAAYFRLKNAVRAASKSNGLSMRTLLRVYLVLLAFFLAGYISAGIMLVFFDMAVSKWLFSLILLFGSVFVTMSILMQLWLCDALSHSNLEILQALIGAVEARDAALRGHSVHVANLSVCIYGALPARLRHRINPVDLEYAALLHDIGKLGIPENILNKPNALTMDEAENIRRHAEIGSNMLRTLPSFHTLAPYVLYHHERPDGAGYLHLSGDDIPLISRVIAVADTYSAITMCRPYHACKAYKEAAEIIAECRGTQLDCEIVDVFLSIGEERTEACRPTDEQVSGAAAWDINGKMPQKDC